MTHGTGLTRRSIVSFMVGGAVAALAACSTSAPPAAAPTTPAATARPAVSAAPHTSWDVSALPDPCRTLTADEIKSVVGGTVSAGRRLESWPPLCQFVLGGTQTGYVYLSDDSGTTGREDYDQKRSGTTPPQAVSGIGDSAYWLADFSTLHVMSGETHLMISFGGPTPPADAQTKIVTLARKALPRTKNP